MENPVDFLTMPVSELAGHSKVRLKIVKTPGELFQEFARAVADEIKANNQAGLPTRLILPVGPLGQYPLLVELCNRERISWRNTHTFNMDEYCDWQGRWIPADHPLSFRSVMQRVLFERLDAGLRIPAGQAHFPDPLNLEQISRDIQSVGGIDTCYGGIGYHGHIAFNEPPISRWARVSIEEFKQSKTRLVSLADDSIVMNSIRNTGGNPAGMPPMAVTLGMADILAARRIRIYCPGGMWQRHTARMAMMAEPQVEYPATLLQGHPDYVLCLDEETAQPAVFTP
jgi:glucosamine-6-phosphate deaminase